MKLKLNKLLRGRALLVIFLLFIIVVELFFVFTNYVKNNICFVVDASLGEDMTGLTLKNNEKLLVIRKKILKNRRNIREGDLILYKKDGEYLIKKVASLKSSKYFNEWNTDFFQYKNIKIKNKTNGLLNRSKPALNLHYGIMTIGGITVKPEGIVVVSDELNKDDTVHTYDVISDFTGWVYPLNMDIIKTIISLWLKDEISKLENTSEDKFINKSVESVLQSETEELMTKLLNNTNYPYKTWEIIPVSLKKYDINNDGQEDVVGFIKSKNKYGTSWHFATWFGDQENYHFYRDGYHELSFSVSKDEEKKNLMYDVPCDIIDLAIDKITLNCQKGGGSETLILHYQPNGVGYFVDPEENLHEFIPQQGWKKFSSKTAGLEFQYPDNLKVVENFYKIGKKKIDFIEVKDNDKLILVVYIAPGVKNEGGGVLGMSQDNVFLQNLDGEYFVRQRYLKDNGNSNFIYYQAEFKQKNNEDSLFNAYNQDFVVFGKKYLFMAFVDDNQIKKVDNIIASTKFFSVSENGDYKEVESMPNQKFQMGGVSWELPGVITNHKTENEMVVENNNKAIAFKDLDVKLINSEFFYPAHITVKLLPYQSIDFENPYGDDGFDAGRNKCYHEKYIDKDKRQKVYEKPRVIGDNKACLFGVGDAGWFVESYYIMDPSKKYILLISQSNDGEGVFIDNILTLNLFAIAKTVKFEEYLKK